jgi:hypothetical protein
MLGLIGLAAGMAAGNRETQQRNRDQMRQDEQDAWTKKEQGRQEQAWGREDKLQRGLASATNKAEVNENGAVLSLADGTKTVYDDADVAGSDFRMLRRADEATGRQTLASADYKGSPSTPQPTEGSEPAPRGLASMLSTGAPTAPVSADTAPTAAGLAGFKVPMAPQRTATMNGKAYGSLTEAQAAGKAYDTPEARSERQAAAYDAAGQPEKSAQMRASITSRELGAIQLGELKQSVADKAVVRKIGALQTPEDIASFITAYPHDGHGGGLKTEVARSADGKTWSMLATKPNGTIVPVPGEFTNDADGMTQAHIALLSKLKPEMRIEMYKWDREFGQKQRVAANTERHQTVLEGAAVTTAEAAKTRAGAVVATSAAKADVAKAGKPLPVSAAKGILENQANLRHAQQALALVNGQRVDGTTGDPEATGWKGFLPNTMLNRADPSGVATRAAIADLGSMVIHDRSGAAVSASEFPRLAPFIPSATDDAATVRKKLDMFTKNYQAIVDDASEFYRSSGYNVPTEVLRNGKGGTGSWGPEKQATPASGAVESGYKFMGGDASNPANWKKVGR